MINVFQLAENDQSVYYLGQIFGNMGIALAGTGSTLLPTMFKVFNSALLVVGTLMIAYVTVMGVLHTAAEGEFLGKKWGNIWLPLRMLLGIAALFPTGTGYCASQVVLMWFIVQGVGAADMVWKSAVEYLGSGGQLAPGAGPSPESIDVTGSLPKMLQTVFANTVCQAAIVKVMSGNANTLVRTAPIEGNAYSFGRTDDPSVKDECGKLTLKGISGKAGALDAQIQATQTILPVLDILANYYVNLIIKDPNCWKKDCNPAQKDPKGTGYCLYFQQYSAMVDTETCPVTAAAGTDRMVSDIISQAGSNFMSDAAKLYYGYAQNFAIQQTIKDNEAKAKSTGIAVNVGDAFAAARANGWIFAGAYYYYIAKKNNAPTDNLADFLTPDAAVSYTGTKISHDASYSDFILNSNDGALKLATALSTAASKSAQTGGGLVLKTGGGLPNEAAGAIGPLADAAISIAGSYIDAITPKAGEDPIVRIHDFGHGLLISADQIFIAFLVIGIVLGIGSTYVIFFGNQLNPFVGLLQFLQSYLIPLVYFFVGYLIVVGGLLGVYLPMLPYMIFTFGAIGWFIGVIEAIVAGPVVALGMLFASGGESELLGKAAPAVMIVLNLFLRPTLMVFGMMAGMLMAIVVLQFINTTFYNVMTNMGSLGIIEAFMFMMVYASLVITALNKCYSLIYHLPERVLTWIGGQPISYGEAQAAEAAKDKVAAAGSAVQKGQQGLTSGMVGAQAKGQKTAMKAKAAALRKGAQQKGGSTADGSGGGGDGGGS